MKHVRDVVKSLTLVTHLTGASNYTWVHFRDGHRLLLAKSLTYFEKLLPTYIRIHKTALVNPAYVCHIQSPFHARASGSVRMQCGDVLPISRRRWPEVANALQTSH